MQSSEEMAQQLSIKLDDSLFQLVRAKGLFVVFISKFDVCCLIGIIDPFTAPPCMLAYTYIRTYICAEVVFVCIWFGRRKSRGKLEC